MSQVSPFAKQPDGRLIGHWRVTPELVKYAEFYFSHASILSQLPYRNSKNGAVLEEITFSCDCCNVELPADRARGLINSYANHTEVRWVADCDTCARVLHNSYRITRDFRIQFQQEDGWYITRPVPWLTRLWARVIARF